MRHLGTLHPRISQRFGVGLLTAVIHIAFLWLLLQPGHYGAGLPDTSFAQLWLLENAADTPNAALASQTAPATRREAPIPDIELAAAELESPTEPRVADVPTTPAALPPAQAVALVPTDITHLPERRDSEAMPVTERLALSKQLTRLAAAALTTPRTEVSFEQDGKQYRATLTRRPAQDGSALEQVTAEVTTTDRGRRLTAQFGLKRLAFSQFTQMVDRWDPGVQLHDDEITGRFHSNSRFSLAYDAHTAPKFLGKVTTAARSFDSDNFGRRRDKEIFAGGIETRSERIVLPRNLQPLITAALDADARIHRFNEDTRIRFYADGTYTWQTRGVSTTGYAREPSRHPIYFIAGDGADLFVQGVVAGKVLVYSPQRIVIEGNLTYVHNPRSNSDAPDYLGLVCDKDIEIAPGSITGPGDLEIHAALFAGRRFVVSDLNRRSATMRIYGSVTAGSLSASEPRYATKIEYDTRFERQRPPGFPSTNRFELDAADTEWVESPP